MRQYLLQKDPIDERDYTFSLKPLASIKLPSSVDIRNLCPPIYDQGQQGSCTANAGCAARTMLAGDPLLYLSRAFLYYQERVIEGTINQDSGASMRSVCAAAKTVGICEDYLMPYNDKDYLTKPSDEAIENAFKYKIKSYRSLSSLEDIKKSLALNQKPVLLGMTVFESMESEEVAKTGQLPMPKSDEKELGGHAVLVVGYKDAMITKAPDCIITRLFLRKKQNASKGYLIVRNSWGVEWGDKGYFYMPYEYVEKYTFDYWIME